MKTQRAMYLTVIDALTDSERHAIVVGKHPSKDPNDPGMGSLMVMVLRKDGDLNKKCPDTIFFEDRLQYVLAKDSEPVLISYSDPTLLSQITNQFK